MVNKVFGWATVLVLAGTITGCSTPYDGLIHSVYSKTYEYVEGVNKVLNTTNHPDARRLIRTGEVLQTQTCKLDNWGQFESLTGYGVLTLYYRLIFGHNIFTIERLLDQDARVCSYKGH